MQEEKTDWGVGVNDDDGLVDYKSSVDEQFPNKTLLDWKELKYLNTTITRFFKEQEYNNKHFLQPSESRTRLNRHQYGLGGFLETRAMTLWVMG